MERTPVSSTNIASIGYDSATQTLEVEFQSHAVYQFSSVPEGVYAELMETDSKESYHQERIRDAYPFSKVA